jgi:Putative zinc-finger
MKEPCRDYTSEEISKFIDNELEPTRYRKVEQHLLLCPACRSLAKNYRTLSAVFTDHADQEISKINTTRLKQELTRQQLGKKIGGNKFKFFHKNIYLKLTSIAAILMISLLAFQVGLFDPSGPSAIVTSVDTDFASVMIIETQREKHTIIWFSET